MASGKYLCHCLRKPPEDIFIDVFIGTCVLRITLVVCAWLVVARWSAIPSSANSISTFEEKIYQLWIIIFVSRYAHLVMTSMMTFAVLTAVRLDTGQAKAYCENTSIVGMIFSYSPLGENSGSRSICMTCSGPKSHSGILMSLGVICDFSICLSWAQVWHSFAHLRLSFAFWLEAKFWSDILHHFRDTCVFACFTKKRVHQRVS